MDNQKIFFDTFAESKGFDPTIRKHWLKYKKTDIQNAKVLL